jgi:hypothetical protein
VGRRQVRDSALGKTRAQRAMGEFYTGNTNRAAQDTRNVSMGQYDGVRASYQRYNVSEQAQDVLNRSIRNRGER